MMKPTPEQQTVIDSEASAILVAAGPGSGKSRVLVERIRRLVSDGTDPARIVCLSFTNSASAVLQERLGDVKLGANTTLHSWLFGLLNQHGGLIGLPTPLSVVDADEEKALLSDALDEVAWKGSLKEVETEVARGPQPKARGLTKAALAAEAFFQRLRADGILTFDLIEYWGLKLLVHHKMKVEADFIFVDEAQDLTELEWQILDVTLIKGFMAIGDTDQRLYSWRGSSDEFEKRCKYDVESKVFTLQQNFRCATSICTAANALMTHQPNRLKKFTVSATGQTGEVIIHKEGFSTDDTEAHAVAEQIGLHISTGRTEANECAVLVRTNYLVDYFRANLKCHGLPVREKPKIELPADWSRAKAALALLANPDNDRLAYQAIKLASGRDKAEEVRRRALSDYKTINETALYLPPGDIRVGAVGSWLARMNISRESLDRISRFASLLLAESPVADLVLAIGRETIQEDEGEGVTIKTLHSAKGSEFEAVWLPAWEQETMPGIRKDMDLEESRRLAFVGITRSRSYLWISWAKRRVQQWGEPKAGTASQFIAECLT